MPRLAGKVALVTGATGGIGEATIETFGGLDILFANAGTEGKNIPLEAQTEENFAEILRTNVVGVWLSMKHAVEPMKQQAAVR